MNDLPWDSASADRTLFSLDVYGEGATPLGVARPRDTAALVEAVRAAARRNVAVVARGGGLSYTRGYLTDRPAVVVDTRAMNRIVTLNVEDRYVTVEAGISWAALDAALAPRRLRAPYWGPLSGIQATVGGALSQGSVFLGSGVHGSVGDSVLGMQVVTGRGEVLATGSAAAGNSPPFFRYFGPDLTGLFVGDCGALGIKAQATLRLIARPQHLDFLSYEYAGAAHLLAAMSAVARTGAASECFAFDPVLAEVRLRRMSLAQDAKTLVNVVRQSGFRAGLDLVSAGRRFVAEGAFSAHAIVEADDPDELRIRLRRVREALSASGREIESSIPKAVRAMPFVPPNSMLGPAGERWVPVHGIVPHSGAAASVDACEKFVAERRDLLEQHEIRVGYLFSTVAAQALLVEPVIYWPDSHTTYHKTMVEPGHLSKIGEPADNARARAVVDELRRGIAAVLRAQGAVHFQLGRFYDYRGGRDPAALQLFDAIRASLDPQGIINPGVLG